MEQTINRLRKLGLKDKDVDTYLAVLAIGKGSVSDISGKAKIKRTSVYQHLEELLKRELIYKTVIGKRIYYSAAHPRKLLSFIEKEKQNLDSMKSSIETIIPDLESIYSKSPNKPRIVFREGEDGILQTYKEMVDTWQRVYSIFSPASFFELFSFEQNHELLMKLKEKGVKLYQLIEKSDKMRERLKRKEYNSFVKSKLLPDDLTFTTDILVTSNRLALISFETLTAIIIEDKALADTQRSFIKFIWKSL